MRENVEGEYSEIGGRLNRGFPDEMAVQESVFTRAGVTRIADYAFELARSRSGYLTSATKSNGIVHTLPFWDEVVAERAGQGVANPVGALWSAVLMLDHLGHGEAAAHLMGGIRASLRDPSTRTRDLGGSASTAAVTEEVVRRVRS